MQFLYILCEGQSEESFVKQVLSPYLQSSQIYTTPIVLGGVSRYSKIREHLKMLGKNSNSILTTMLDYYKLPSDTPGVKECKETQPSAIAEYIEQHFAETIDNRSVAQALNYHHNYLNAVFRREMGTTLHRYLMQVRLKKAAELLQESKDSVAEVASRVGFLNADHFSRRFSEQYGVSPSRYRKGIGKEETVRREDGQNGKSV